METRILVTAEELMSGRVTHTNTAYFVYVALDERGRPAEVPALLLETDEERRHFEEGAQRQALRLERRRDERPPGR